MAKWFYSFEREHILKVGEGQVPQFSHIFFGTIHNLRGKFTARSLELKSVNLVARLVVFTHLHDFMRYDCN